MSNTFKNTDEFDYMQQAWATWQDARGEIEAEFEARRRELDAYHRGEFVHAVGRVKAAGGAKNWIRRATGVTPWPDVQKWWDAA